jgi:hypothetical protein
MARKLTLEERIERAQELGRIRWNAMVRREEEMVRRETQARKSTSAVSKPHLRIVR